MVTTEDLQRSEVQRSMDAAVLHDNSLILIHLQADMQCGYFEFETLTVIVYTELLQVDHVQLNTNYKAT